MDQIYIAWGVAFAVVCGIVMITFMIRRFIRRQDERLKLIMKTLYLNTKGIKSVGEKTDVIIQEQQTGLDYQRKSFDHHRVLVSSLARQLKHIEAALYTGGNIDPNGTERHDNRVVPTDGTVNAMIPEQPLRNSTVTSFVREQRSELARQQGVTLLKSLFDRKQQQAIDPDGDQQKIARLSTLFNSQPAGINADLNEQQRRVSNG